MTAEEVKAALYVRHFASRPPMPGPWTCTEEWRGIDFLAFGAWSSKTKFRRVGYEVKVSRSDLRSELLKPAKRVRNVAWCHQFFFAVPRGLLTDEELSFTEPDWEYKDFVGPPCPAGCRPHRWRSKKHYLRVPIPVTGNRALWEAWEYILCPVCDGKGAADLSRVETEAPYLWIPKDVGLVVIDGRGTTEIRKSPIRSVEPLDDRELGQLIRWISCRPDPRHIGSARA